MKKKERSIGEKFYLSGVHLEVVDHAGCQGCIFHINGVCTATEDNLEIVGECNRTRRKDTIPVIFREIEDIEEPVNSDPVEPETHFFGDSDGHVFDTPDSGPIVAEPVKFWE